ncbi:uncharacterized protein DUF4919 [Roseimicrobium gellanilyticum]|uniref:Uncharacterized protein DUF4919 n=1 Tax=Roseimicrobium gellanilyticum TaxID=748857 RepID=A0A366H0Y5_9BACT|nr:DUF4919 domain-containing protein [Roseimicrobium gellanilyticum]RBP35535.1 uncharacterized protein DUF4919 [Roseimicrobium gellanilyticum]
MEDLKKLFVEFLQAPTQENFLNVRNAVLADAQFDPYTDAIDGVPKMMEAGELEQALEVMKHALFPHLVLSPGAHLNIAFVLHKLGREKDAAFEHHISQMLQKAIEETGDGTEARPYLVTRTSDEYDYLFAHELEAKTQALAKSPDGKHEYDVLTTTTGQQIWFDVTDISRVLARRMERAGEASE